MLPSILAAEVRANLRHFLVSAYEASDPFFHGVVQRFVDRPEALDRGPYLQLGLPFRPGDVGREFFGEFSLPHPGYAHQEAAWQRVASDRGAVSTLIASGTGSGKTECFLYPLLDHCRRARKSAPGGIRALVIYPMNALASDQARRFAEVIVGTPAFAGLRVGLYVGGGGRDGTHAAMGPDHVITDREALRKSPPDVLLTNYKMLDYLLVRPKDRALWAGNDAETLRYVVVDELHTFDGAQGTDLALLLRRLKARLGTPAGHLIAVGTSATLGSGDTRPLCDYATQIFGEPFAADAVITEQRDSVAQFLGEWPIAHVQVGHGDLARVLDPAQYPSPAAAVAGWFGLFFPDEPAPADVTDPRWRQALGLLLKQHLLLNNLLKLLNGGVGHLPTLQEKLSAPMPAAARGQAGRVLDAFLALLAWARQAENPALPLVTLRVQLWMREQRRLLAPVDARPQAIELQPDADLKANQTPVHLPLVQCSECRSTGWVGYRTNGSTRYTLELTALYNAWFRGAPEVVRLYPVAGLAHEPEAARRRHACGQCGVLQDSAGACVACRNPETVAVWELQPQTQSERGGAVCNWHEKTCPACGSKDRLLLLGARSATLGAQIIEQTWASPYNDDKKLIAFSDSVQDAAHRAGFFGARTYTNNVRMAIGRLIEREARPRLSWSQLLQRLPHYWRNEAGYTPERFVTEFIGPNMQWQREWTELMAQGRIAATAPLVERVGKRLAWQAVAEFTYRSMRGRTLERVGLATLVPSAAAVEAVLPALGDRLAEALGLRRLTSTDLRHWLWGLLLQLRRRGAVTHPELAGYFEDGNFYGFLKRGGREYWLPPLSTWGPHPAFLALEDARHGDRLLQRGGQSWYQRWFRATLGRTETLMARGIEAEAYGIAIELLAGEGVLAVSQGRPGRYVGLAAEALALDTQVAVLRTARGRRRLVLPAEVAESLLGMPCLDAMQEQYVELDTELAAERWMARRYREGDLRRVLPAEHTGLLSREDREQLETRFKAKPAEVQPWYENLLSATPTLEMGVDIGSLSSVLLCSVPPSQAGYLQRIGRAGRRDGNAMVVTLADGASSHDLYFYEQPLEMMAGEVSPPGVFLEAAEVLRRQLLAFCIDAWVATGIPDTAFPDKTGPVLEAVERRDVRRFPFNLLDFIQSRDAELLERFGALLGDALTPRVRTRLADYMLGAPEVDSLRVALLKVLEELAGERSAYRKRAEELKSRLKHAQARVQDEASQHECEELARERDKALELAQEISQRDLLGTLTDSGLIPNYAFPEAGIELKSFIWRKGGESEPGGRGPRPAAERYERPAASALSELAPENRFYANRRQVEIDQVNMQLAKIEPWRLCPRCHHVENLDVAGDIHPACPRCGDPMWSNVAQKRQLLRFRQAMASSEDAESRIDDSHEDREPRFYVRQLLVDFEPSAVAIAWKLESDAVSFGFEFIRKALFRDINFGESGRGGENLRVADRELARPGFKLCRHCGRVQQGPRRPRDGQPAAPAQDHSRDCVAYGGNDPEAIVDCLYLYREFSSEALRILVPYTRSGMDDTVLQSFMAALQLGLKRRFGGRVDHLRITTQEQPGPDDQRRQYVLIYDSVPGGTGYLHQLLSLEAESLGEVLRMALAAVQSCACRAHADKDGCYRCVYQYRQGRSMTQVSRRQAEELLDDLVQGLGGLVRVPSIAEMRIDPKLGSELEREFLDALPKLSGVSAPGGAPLPTVRMWKEIVEGSNGWMLEADGQRWSVLLQVDLGEEQGVAAASRPDFLLKPAKPGSRRPIAVFADGWTYHQNSMREDARKRSALVASGSYWVWSLVWDDVAAARKGDPTLDGDVLQEQARLPESHPLLAQLTRAAAASAPRPRENAMARLLRFLAEPAAEADRRLTGQALYVLGRLTVDPGDPSTAAMARHRFDVLAQSLPEGVVEAGVAGNPCTGATFAGPLQIHSRLLPDYLKGRVEAGAGVVLIDAALAGDGSAKRLAWRGWLHAYNTLQALPGHFLVEAAGLQHGDYLDLRPRPPAPAPVAIAPGEGWAELLASVIAELAEGVAALQAAGCPLPDEVGHELATDQCNSADAELAWFAPRVLLLAEHQVEGAAAWQAAGWTVVRADEGDWVATLCKLLGEAA